MTLIDILKKSSARLLTRSVSRPALSYSVQFVPGLTELEKRETPAAAEWLSGTGIQAEGLGLTGVFIGLGQVELGRPALAIDAKWNAKVNPTEVMVLEGAPKANDSNTEHATAVAGILISTNNIQGVGGLARDAKLYSAGLETKTQKVDHTGEEVTRTFQAIALKNNDDISAINFSSGLKLRAGEKFDGTSTYTKGVDFVAARHHTLIVLSGINNVPANVYPRDAYNVLTVRSAIEVQVDEKEAINNDRFVSARVRSDAAALVTDDPEATRRNLTHLIAAAPRMVAGTVEGGQAADIKADVTDSYTAPLVTGTVALLQEHARKATSGIGDDGKQEEVMKAILINSVDKQYGVLDGMTRTVLGKNGTSKWANSDAADIPGTAAQNTARQALPLDTEMGAGFLNAERALRQLKGKQHAPNTEADRIGWDYRSITRVAGAQNPTRNVYKLPQLKGGSYISATLTWNRDVSWTDSNNNGKYDENEPLAAQPLANLDVYLVERNETDLLNKSVWSSRSVQYNVEHFFFQLPMGNKPYDLVVVQNTVAATNYGLAWWAETPKPNMQGPHKIEGIASGDTNGNGTREPGLGEIGLMGIPVQLLDSNNQVLDETTTNFAGAYQFQGVSTGNYTVKFVTPARASITAQDVYNPPSADDTNDSDINTLGTVGIYVDQDKANIDAGYVFGNAKPVGVADTYTAPHGGTLTIPAANGVLANDSDPEGATLTAELFREPYFGTLNLAANGSFTYSYTPTLGFSGPVTFEYVPVDTAGVGDPVTVTIVIPNSAPDAVNDSVTAYRNNALSIDVRINDTDADSDALTITSVTQGANGTVTFTSTGLTYTPNTDFTGTDSFTYTVDDGYGGTDTATVTVTVALGGTVTGRVWDDTDHDGIQDTGEGNRVGIQVWLLDINNNVIATTYTNSSGVYTFANVVPGQYKVRVALPPNTTFTLQNEGSNDAVDSDVDSGGYTALFTVTSGGLFDIDAGLWPLGSGGGS